MATMAKPKGGKGLASTVKGIKSPFAHRVLGGKR